MTPEWLTAGAAGIVLAASAGLRAFLPLFAAAIAARVLDWPLAASVEWLSSDLALVGLGVATVVEIVADKVPVVDHGLDAVHTIVAPLAGALVAFSVWAGLPAPVAMLLALALGAPLAGGVHALSAATRVKSTIATGGAANPVVSAAEDGISVVAVATALLVPVLAVVGAVTVLWLVARFVVRRVRRKAPV